MKSAIASTLVLVFGLVACGGVRDQIRTSGRPGSFDAREIVDVLPAGRIASIDPPRFEPADAAGTWLTGSEPVIVVAVVGDARAYPLAILVWHEVVDDVVGGVPVAITYSPLCNTAIVFDRRVAGRAERLASSGKLYRSNLVMYDRRTRSLWTQLDGRAVAGPAKGSALTGVPSQIASFEAFRSSYPRGIVLARPEASGRSYGFDPYAGYDSRTAPYSGFFSLAPDRRLPPMERVVGVAAGPRSYPYRTLQSQRVIEDRLGGRDIVVLWEPGASSALDAARMSAGRDVGETGVFYAKTGARPVHIVSTEAGFRDRETGSAWNALGTATAGPLAGAHLEPVVHVDAFWFAWAAFYPRAVV